MYSQKTIQNLKPAWYLQLSTKEKLEMQEKLRKDHKEAWENKPPILKSGTLIIADITKASISKGKTYTILNHFCTLITTIYGSEWRHFVTLKNDYGYSVKMNLNSFTIK